MPRKRKHLLPYIILGLFFFYGFHWLVKLYQSAPGVTDPLNPFSKYAWVINNLETKNWLDLQFNQFSLIGGALGFVLPFFIYLRVGDNGVYRHGEERGSARFATVKEIATFRDKVFENNMILTKNGFIGLFNKLLPYDKQLNKNTLVVGLPGDGKTQNYVKPNLMQMNGSYIVTDPKGLLVHEVGSLLAKNGYKIKVFDLVHLANSNTFNIFNYMKSELDIDRVTEAIVDGTKKTDNQGENFWLTAELLLTRALIGYLYFDSQLDDYTPNLSMVADMMRNIRRTDEEQPSPVEQMFEELEERLPGNYAYKQWALFNSNFEAETRMGVTTQVATRYSIFDHADVAKMIAEDTMDIDRWNIEKTAVFIAIPETNKSFNFLASLLFATIFEELTHGADAILQGERPGLSATDLLHVQVIIDEFANIGKIPNFNEVLASVRSREISIKIIIQAINQLKSLYNKDWETIFNNCACHLFLGTNDKDTMNYYSTRAGKQTINQKQYSESRGRNRSSSFSEQTQQRELMTPDEVARIGVDEALLFLSKQNVLKDKKFYVKDHKNAQFLSNSPQDDNWYTYERRMDGTDDWYENVDQTEFVDLQIEENAA